MATKFLCGMSRAVKVAILLGCALQCGVALAVILAVLADADLGGTLEEWQAVTVAAAAANLIGVGAWVSDERFGARAAARERAAGPSRC
jgi:hypothetical protein